MRFIDLGRHGFDAIMHVLSFYRFKSFLTFSRNLADCEVVVSAWENELYVILCWSYLRCSYPNGLFLNGNSARVFVLGVAQFFVLICLVNWFCARVVVVFKIFVVFNWYYYLRSFLFLFEITTCLFNSNFTLTSLYFSIASTWDVWFLTYRLRRCSEVHILSGNAVNVLEVPPEISTLSKGLVAKLTLKGPLSSMFAEMVTQVATFFEQTATIVKSTFEE